MLRRFRARRIHYFAALGSLALAVGCSSTPPSATIASPSSASAPSKEKEASLKKAGFERELAIAREKLAKAKRDVMDQELSGSAAVLKARADVELTQARLRTIDEKEAPNRLAKANLDLQAARDSQDDSKEELEQLEIMYKEQDLADKTREIVIRRSKRQLARAADRLKLQEDDVKILSERTLPQEREKLVLEIADKQRAHEQSVRASESGLFEKRLGILVAEAEVARLERELEALAADGKAAK